MKRKVDLNGQVIYEKQILNLTSNQRNIKWNYIFKQANVLNGSATPNTVSRGVELYAAIL
jgi:hypothetical protein